jgi:hypothetical protein
MADDKQDAGANAAAAAGASFEVVHATELMRQLAEAATNPKIGAAAAGNEAAAAAGGGASVSEVGEAAGGGATAKVSMLCNIPAPPRVVGLDTLDTPRAGS